MRFLLALLLVAPCVRANDFFTTQVRPLLASHCFKCHGPDEATRKARLRLDMRAEALRPARSKKRAVVPGKPAESELIARIYSTDDAEVMPPAAAKRPLTDAQKAILKKWIADGAAFSRHWAFVPPVRPAVPPAGGRNPIDAFIRDRLQHAKLTPTPQADRATLARRVSLDLTGIPPSTGELDSFLADTRPDAYERFVERLLASPAYGERWARKWLDLARYADTNGYEKDRPRSMWPWRDWVIRSLNAGMPFDRFSIEQLAGDMLPGATQAQRIATGFHRNTMLNEEGGIDPLEFRFYSVVDRVATTGITWLGLTLGCAQCHTHKFDPISHREYYGVFAYLNNADEKTREVVEKESLATRIASLKKADEAEKRLASLFPGGDKALEKAFRQWLAKERKRAAAWHLLRPARAVSNLPSLDIQKDGSVFASGDMSKADTCEIVFKEVPEGTRFLRLEALADPRLPKGGPGRIYYEGPFGDFFLSEFTVLADGKPVKVIDASHSFAAGGNTAKKAIDGNKQTGWSINGRQGRDSHAVFRLEKPLGMVRELKVRLLFERYYAAGLGRFRFRAAGDGPALARDLPLDADTALLAGDKERLRQIFLSVVPELTKGRQRIADLRKSAFPTTLVFQERPAQHPRPTRRHHRGEFLQPRERVEAGLPASIAGTAVPKDRLGFARWLFSQENPLTARVVANRHWASLFGTGLVKTVEDFGYQGEAPSHPQLLDWLAVEFQDSGWDLKRLHRLLVTSATYRQSSATTAELREKDPQNRLLARGPRQRLEAEQVRDTVLSVSGLLAMKLGGPSVFPPQPAGVTTEGAYGKLAWKVSPGLDRYRRGLYTFAKRTAPYALGATFDGPSGEVCIARREVTNTALQALALLNDEVILEAAQHLGRRMAIEKGDDTARAGRLFRRVLGRFPSGQERAKLVAFVVAQRERAAKKEFDAIALAGPGAAVEERAAWTALARVLFNLDEFIVKG